MSGYVVIGLLGYWDIRLLGYWVIMILQLSSDPVIP